MFEKNDTIQRLLSMALLLSSAGLLVLLMILYPGAYIFVFVVVALLVLGMIFVGSITDQERTERKKLLDKVIAATGLVMQDNSYRTISGRYGGRESTFSLVSDFNGESDRYDMQLMMSLNNHADFVLSLRTREADQKRETQGEKSRLEKGFEINGHPKVICEALFASPDLRDTLFTLKRAIEIKAEGPEISLQQPLYEFDIEVAQIIQLFDLLCEFAERIEQLEQVVG